MPKPHHKGDFLDNILAAKNEDGSPINIEEVGVEGFVLLEADSDTRASFCGFVRYILETPGVYDKMVHEIDEFDRQGLLSSPVPSFNEIKLMTLLPAFVKPYVISLQLHSSSQGMHQKEA